MESLLKRVVETCSLVPKSDSTLLLVQHSSTCLEALSDLLQLLNGSVSDHYENIDIIVVKIKIQLLLRGLDDLMSLTLTISTKGINPGNGHYSNAHYTINFYYLYLVWKTIAHIEYCIVFPTIIVSIIEIKRVADRDEIPPFVYEDTDNFSDIQTHVQLKAHCLLLNKALSSMASNVFIFFFL